MKLILKIANFSEIKQVQTFFDKQINDLNTGIVSDEFRCPYGISGAIKRRNIVILKNENNILGALRFYPRKRDDIVSIYQFALDKKIRGRGLILEMLNKTGYSNFESACFADSKFNTYYEKSGWVLGKKDSQHNYRQIKRELIN